MRINRNRDDGWLIIFLALGAVLYAGKKIIAGQYMELAMVVLLAGVVIALTALAIQYLGGSRV